MTNPELHTIPTETHPESSKTTENFAKTYPSEYNLVFHFFIS